MVKSYFVILEKTSIQGYICQFLLNTDIFFTSEEQMGKGQMGNHIFAKIFFFFLWFVIGDISKKKN